MDKLRKLGTSKDVVSRPSRAAFVAQAQEMGMSKAHARALYRELGNDVIWTNDTYMVNVHDNKATAIEGMLVTHLSIKRHDNEPCTDWRDFQEIKNQICGPEREGMQIHPAESRLVDGANQFHLWVLPEGMKIPIGFFDGRRVTDDPGFQGAKQLPRVDEYIPA